MVESITANQFRAFLSELRGATFGSIVTLTDPKRASMRVTAVDGSGDRNPWFEGAGRSLVSHIRKLSRIQIILNENYEAGVRRQMEREGLDPDAWEPGETWYERCRRVDGTLLPFGEHKGDSSLYLCGVNKRNIVAPVYYDMRDGSVIATEDAERFIPDTERYGKQRRAGLTRVIKRQVWSFESIRAANLMGHRFRLVSDDIPPVFQAISEQIAASERDHEATDDTSAAAS